MKEKDIEYVRFTKPLIDDGDELEERMDKLTERQKIAYAKLARKIKPVLRCGITTKVEEICGYKVTEFNKSPKIITSVSTNGQLEVKGQPREIIKSALYDVIKVPDKWRIMTLNEIVDETSTEYREGFFGYADGGYNIFNGFCSRTAIVCKAPKLEQICEIATLHYSAYADTFMPSEAEVLIQIPSVLKNHVDAYELYLPNPEHDQVLKDYKLYDQHHKAYARLFRLADGEKEPDEIKKYYDRISIEDTIG